MFWQAELDILNPMQLQILMDKGQGLTLQQLCSKYNFNSNQKIIHYITRTLLGIKIDSPNDIDGRTPLIGDVPASIFVEKCFTYADLNNCLPSHKAIHIFEQIVAEHLYHSYKVAQAIHCPFIAQNIIQKIDTIEISHSWLKAFCKKHQLELLNPQTLEINRNKYCHQNIVYQFHLMLRQYIHQCPYLLFNADETSSTYNKKTKVVCPIGKQPLTEDQLQFSHFTMMLATNAAGHAFKPFIIMPALDNFPAELETFRSQANFASSSSGWMTSKVFSCWTICFIHEFISYRISIEGELRKHGALDAPCFLFLDGHRSRLNSEAIEMFYSHGIHIVIFPSHCTHVLQPFDVALAAPLKVAIHRFGQTIPKYMAQVMDRLPCKAQRIRYKIVHTLIDAWRNVSTFRNIQSGWAKCGLFPFDYTPLLNNPLIRASNVNDVMAPPQRGVVINGMILSDFNKRLEIAQHFYRRQLTSIPQPDKELLIQNLKDTNGDEHFLTPPPPYSFCPIPGVILQQNYF